MSQTINDVPVLAQASVGVVMEVVRKRRRSHYAVAGAASSRDKQLNLLVPNRGKMPLLRCSLRFHTVSMGTGTDVAMESASVTLVRGDLLGVAKARTLSQATMRNIRQNLFFAFACNTAGIPLASGVLYSVLGSLLSSMTGAAAMSLSSFPMFGNALRVRRLQLKRRWLLLFLHVEFFHAVGQRRRFNA